MKAFAVLGGQILDLARRDLADHDGGADHVGGALFAFWHSGKLRKVTPW